ncbi:MAG: cytochrome b/b6 domain-containing protein [Paracoccaceae bacterium]
MANQNGYSWLQIGLHWVIALLIVFQFLFHEGMEDAYKAVQKGQDVVGNGAQIHVIVGILVLTLTLLRLIIRFRRGVPPAVPGGFPFQELASKLAHWGLYALLILVPASGMAAWGGGIKPAADVHEILTSAMIFLIALHAAAALFHHYILKDGLIKRMTKAG